MVTKFTQQAAIAVAGLSTRQVCQNPPKQAGEKIKSITEAFSTLE